ncbi:hypothetical protein AX15_003673 [Amanita polypyramis BW_CC]|nr:hypothetical protein AX15_003673 [Amanita polypyramis BW_CC]
MARSERHGAFSTRGDIVNLGLPGSNEPAQAAGDLVIGQLDNGVSVNGILTNAGLTGDTSSITESGQDPMGSVTLPLGCNNVGTNTGGKNDQGRDADGVVDTTVEGLDGHALFTVGSDVVSTDGNANGDGALGSATPNAGQNNLINQIATVLGPHSADVNSGDNTGQGPGSVGNVNIRLPTGNVDIALGSDSGTVTGPGQGTISPNSGNNPNDGSNGQNAPGGGGNGQPSSQGSGNSPDGRTNGPAGQSSGNQGDGPQNDGGPPDSNMNPNGDAGPANSGAGNNSSPPPPNDSQPQNTQPPSSGSTNRSGNPSNTPPQNTSNNANGAGNSGGPNNGPNNSGNGSDNVPGNGASPGDNGGGIVTTNIGGPNTAIENDGGIGNFDILDAVLNANMGLADLTSGVVIAQG